MEEVGGELTQAFLSCLVTEKFSEDDGKLKIDLHFLSWDESNVWVDKKKTK